LLPLRDSITAHVRVAGRLNRLTVRRVERPNAGTVTGEIRRRPFLLPRLDRGFERGWIDRRVRRFRGRWCRARCDDEKYDE
jgi:hypothetical protein